MSEKSLRIELTAKDQEIAKLNDELNHLHEEYDYHLKIGCEASEEIGRLGKEIAELIKTMDVKIRMRLFADKKLIEARAEITELKGKVEGLQRIERITSKANKESFKALQQNLSVAEKALEIIKGGMSEKGPRVIAEQALKTIRGET